MAVSAKFIRSQLSLIKPLPPGQRDHAKKNLHLNKAPIS